jgi:oligoendopeptidase F
MTAVLRTRDTVEPRYRWNLDSIYASDDRWEADYHAVEQQFPALAAYEGKATTDGAAVYAVLALHDTIKALVERLLVYASLRRDEDLTHSANQARFDRAVSLEARFQATAAFLRPELLAVEDTTFEEWFRTTPELALYRVYLDDLRRLRPHVRSADVEALIAQARELAQTPVTVFGALNDADLRFGTVRDVDGNEIELSHGRVWAILEQPDRELRRQTWELYDAAYRAHQNTLSATLNGMVRANIFQARARGYASALEAALFPDAIPPAVYHTLIDTVNNHLDVRRRYLDVRKRVLGVDTLYEYDRQVPLAPPAEAKLDYDAACEIVLEALAPLGQEYTDVLRRGLYEAGWVDVYETANKRSGAYSWGAYGTAPVMLLNWQSLFSDLFILAHEIGHSMHTYFTNQHQPYTYGSYTIFLAEVASTCNEALLFTHLLRTASPQQRRALLDQQLRNIDGTLFVQTMFAAFEREMHERIERGEALAPEQFTEIGQRIAGQFLGPDGLVDPTAGGYWMAVPHFYYNFYVYKYATGISAGLALAHQILTEGQPAVDRYLTFLSSGNSRDSITLLQQAGVDMTTARPVEQAIQVFTSLLDEFEALVDVPANE